MTHLLPLLAAATVGLPASGSTGARRTQPVRADADTAMSSSSRLRLTAVAGVDMFTPLFPPRRVSGLPPALILRFSQRV